MKDSGNLIEDILSYQKLISKRGCELIKIQGTKNLKLFENIFNIIEMKDGVFVNFKKKDKTGILATIFL